MPTPANPADGNALRNTTLYYQYRDSAGEMHVVDSLELVPREALKHVHKVYLRNMPVAAPSTVVDVPLLNQAQAASQTALGTMATQLGVTPPPPPAAYTAMPVTTATALVPSVPVIRAQAYSPSVFGPIAALLALGMLPRATRGICMRMLATGIGMVVLGSGYLNWANAHGYRRVGPPTPGAIVQEAVDAAQTVKSHNDEQQRILDEIDRGR